MAAIGLGLSPGFGAAGETATQGAAGTGGETTDDIDGIITGGIITGAGGATAGDIRGGLTTGDNTDATGDENATAGENDATAGDADTSTARLADVALLTEAAGAAEAADVDAPVTADEELAHR